ncbi:PAS domain S-box protein [Mesorhizobium sp. WSM4307]|nr:PAS domain S-box protein [Mesorhizobium sp. WSM4315]TRC86725.1 PAS domain S-box protein [Mesorhizobium sp. WSM4307]
MSISVVAFPLGIAAGIGWLVAGSRRHDFPSQTEHLRLGVAVTHATVAFREVRDLANRPLPRDARYREPTEAAPAEGERALQLFIDTIPAAAYCTTADGMVELINRHHLDYVGRTYEEMKGLGFLGQFHPDDLPGLLSTWQGMLASKQGGDLEGRVRRADGEYRWTLIRTAPLLDDDGNVVRWYGVNTDIEDRKRTEDSLRAAEAALAATERNFSLMIDSLPLLVWSSRADGSADYVNKHYLEYAGLPERDIMGWGYVDLLHPDDVDGMVARWKAQLDLDWAVNQARLRRHDGEYRRFYFAGRKFIDSSGAVRWFGANIDIEDLKRAEDALKESEAALRTSERKLQEIISTIPGLVWTASPDGAATFANQHYLDFFGFSAEDALGRGWSTAVHPDDLERLLRRWASMLESGRGGDAEARMRRADGQYRWLLFRTNPLYDVAGNLTQWFGINTDIDDRKRAEEELREAQAELAHVTRLITMGELAVSIAHEVNQPLMAIVTNAATCLRWLEEGKLDVAQARQAAERIVRDGHHAGEVIASIRALARKSSPLIERMDLGKAIREMLELIQGQLGRAGIQPTLEFSDDKPEVFGDRTQLQQVVLNLILNSVEAMADTPDGQPLLHIQVSIGDEGFAEVRITDNGPGIDPHAIDRLFDAFFTTKPNGIGMGLSICRSIIDGHGGQIWASQNTPKGSVFHFTVPLAVAA